MVTLPLLLGFSWAGEQFAWLSWPSLGLFGGVCILLVVLIFYSVREERLGREPIVEPSMFKDVRVFSISLCATMLISVAMLGSVYFLPVFLQSVVSVSATDSGLALIPFALASIMGAIVNGLLITATGRYKWTALVATVIMIVGILLLLRLDIHARSLDVVGAVVVFGLGAGASLALYTVVVQNAMPSRIGQATSTLVFFRQLGQSIGLAALGGVVTTSYVPAFYRSLPPQLRESMPLVRAFENPLVLLSPQVMASIHSGFEHYGPQGQAAYNALLNAVKTGLTESIHQAFLLSLGLMLITLILVIFLKEIPLRSRKETS
jgi:drug/metabolite transporter (DMT)-like permease